MQEKLHEVVQPYSQLQRKKQPLIDQDDKHYDHPRLPKFKIVISRQFCLLGMSTLHIMVMALMMMIMMMMMMMSMMMIMMMIRMMMVVTWIPSLL